MVWYSLSVEFVFSYVFCEGQRFTFDIHGKRLEALVIGLEAKECKEGYKTALIIDFAKQVAKHASKKDKLVDNVVSIGEKIIDDTRSSIRKEKEEEYSGIQYGRVSKITKLELRIQRTTHFRLYGAEQEQSVFCEGVVINDLHEKLIDIGLGGRSQLVKTILLQAFSSRVSSTENGMDMKHPSGALLYGPPGSGKTFLAQKIVLLLRKTTLKIITAIELKGKLYADTAEKVKKLFQEAVEDDKINGPNSKLYVFIIDELDAMDQDGNSNSVHQCLSMLDRGGFAKNIFIFGISNRLNVTDVAFRRVGCFGLRFEVENPDEVSRKEMIEVILQKRKDNNQLEDDINVTHLARRTEGFSSLELGRELLLKAWTCAFERNNYTDLDLKYQMKDFHDAIDQIESTRKKAGKEVMGIGCSYQ